MLNPNVDLKHTNTHKLTQTYFEGCLPDLIEADSIKKILKLILEREKGAEREKERERKRHQFCCFIYLCIHWLFLVCGLTQD